METYAAAEELLAAKEQFDIVFLDIKMEGLNGIEAAKKLRERNSYGIQEETVLIFVTGAREYVFEAFDVTAFHYLLKPPEEKKLIEVFDRAVKEAEKRKGREQAQLVLKTGGRSVTLKPDRILYIENRGRKLEIHTAVREERIEIYAA